MLKKFLSILVIASFLIGNFWFFPIARADDWDTTVAVSQKWPEKRTIRVHRNPPKGSRVPSGADLTEEVNEMVIWAKQALYWVTPLTPEQYAWADGYKEMWLSTYDAMENKPANITREAYAEARKKSNPSFWFNYFYGKYDTLSPEEKAKYKSRGDYAEKKNQSYLAIWNGAFTCLFSNCYRTYWYNTKPDWSGTYYRMWYPLPADAPEDMDLYLQWTGLNDMLWMFSDIQRVRPTIYLEENNEMNSNLDSKHTTVETSYQVDQSWRLHYKATLNFDKIRNSLRVLWWRIDKIKGWTWYVKMKIDKRLEFDKDIEVAYESTWQRLNPAKLPELDAKNIRYEWNKTYFTFSPERMERFKNTDWEYEISIPVTLIDMKKFAELSFEDFMKPMWLSVADDYTRGLNASISEDSYNKIATSENPVIRVGWQINLEIVWDTGWFLGIQTYTNWDPKAPDVYARLWPTGKLTVDFKEYKNETNELTSPIDEEGNKKDSKTWTFMWRSLHEKFAWIEDKVNIYANSFFLADSIDNIPTDLESKNIKEPTKITHPEIDGYVFVEVKDNKVSDWVTEENRVNWFWSYDYKTPAHRTLLYAKKWGEVDVKYYILWTEEEIQEWHIVAPKNSPVRKDYDLKSFTKENGGYVWIPEEIEWDDGTIYFLEKTGDKLTLKEGSAPISWEVKLEKQTIKLQYAPKKGGDVEVIHKTLDGTIILRWPEDVKKDDFIGTKYETENENQIVYNNVTYNFVKHDEKSAPINGRVKSDKQTVVYLYDVSWGGNTPPSPNWWYIPPKEDPRVNPEPKTPDEPVNPGSKPEEPKVTPPTPEVPSKPNKPVIPPTPTVPEVPKTPELPKDFEPIAPIEIKKPEKKEEIKKEEKKQEVWNKIRKYGKKLPKTGAISSQEIYKKVWLVWEWVRRIVETRLPNKEIFRLAGNTNTELSHWLEVLPKEDRNKNKYVVIPSSWLVMPINEVKENSKEYNNFINGWEEDFHEILKTGSVEIPWTSLNGYGETWNKVIAWHSSYFKNSTARYKTHFQKIIWMEKNEEIWIYEKDETGKYTRYVYKVRASYNTKDTDIEVIKPTESSVLTLFTCTPIWGVAGRWIVKADFSYKN